MHKLDELRAHLEEVDAKLVEMTPAEDEDRSFSDEEQAAFDTLKAEAEETLRAIEKIEERQAVLEAAAKRDLAREEIGQIATRRAGVATGDDIYDMRTLRKSPFSEEGQMELRDRALRSVEAAEFPHERADKEYAQGHIERLLKTIDGPGVDKVPGELARRILLTGKPAYQRAFQKTLVGMPLTAEETDAYAETRALSVGTGSAGGFAIVYQLDPTIIPTSNWVVNPWRAISNVESIAGTNEWRGVTSGAITATRVTEGTEATDNSPTLTQPALIVTKVHAFVPFSIEVGQDWGALQAEMARLIQDAKDVEESAAFATGSGTPPAPQGVITAGTTVTAGGVASFAVADVYKAWEALKPRSRANAKWAGNLFTYDKIRQFDTAGGASLFVQNLTFGQQNANAAGTLPEGSMYGTLLGKPAYESSDMDSALTTGKKIAVVGDFDKYKIVDRIGMDVEIIPQLFGAANRFPTGQRGIYAYWRNYAKVLDATAFQVLTTG